MCLFAVNARSRYSCSARVGRQFHDHLNVAIAVRLVHLDDKPPCGAVNDAMVVLAAWAQLPNDPDLRFLISDIIRFHLMSPNNH
jgi:hypothetical protein